MTKLVRQQSRKRVRQKPAHTITPAQAEFLMDIRKYQLSHSQQGAAAKDLANQERSLAMVRKLASALSNADPPFVVSQSAIARTVRRGNRKIVSFTRYRLTEQKFVTWPRTAVFLLECRGFPRDENTTIGIKEIAGRLKEKHGFSDAEFKEDWDYIVERKYIHKYRARFSTDLRIDAELEWLVLLAREYKAILQR